MPLSRKTLAALARALPSLGHSQLSVWIYEYNLEASAVGGNLTDRSLGLVRAVETVYGQDAEKVFLEIIERFLLGRGAWALENDAEVRALLKSLQLDGFDFTDGKLIPTTPGVAALGPEISALEGELQNLGFNVALAHYRQSVDNFVNGNSEACNGQTRPFIENLCVTLCARVAQQQMGNPKAAIDHLRNTNLLDGAESSLLKAFWDGIQDNGPHHGLSSPEEALFRLHLATAIARYMLHKFGEALNAS